jgi:hypothetical protein
MVSYARVLMRVLDVSDEPGSSAKAQPEQLRMQAGGMPQHRLTECNVAVRADAAQEELNAAERRDLGFVAVALSLATGV